MRKEFSSIDEVGGSSCFLVPQVSAAIAGLIDIIDRLMTRAVASNR